LLDNDVSCAYPLQGANNASIKEMKMRQYHLAQWKAVEILKQNGHLLLEGQEI